MDQFEALIGADSFHWDQLQDLLSQRVPDDTTAVKESFQRLALGSNYAIAQLIRQPELIDSLIDVNAVEQESQTLNDFHEEITDLDQIKKWLRHFRHRKLVEIIYQDICRQLPVEQTLLRLSELADLLIQQALLKAERVLSAKHGQPLDAQGVPMQLNIIGMGKLGGNELNFSSDIDLICCYSEDGELSGSGRLSHAEYFTQLVKLFKQLLHEPTEDGFVYRVDLRLRPWGDAGPLALSHNAFEHYYQLHGREWEQYAMVKARIICGSASDCKHLGSIIQPFVYRRYHDYRVFDGLFQLKLKIDQQARQRGIHSNIKIGRGGIREIEFFVQAFQILKGGRNHSLQTTSLFQAIRSLSEQRIIDQQTLDQMRESYCFLRQLENRIQMFNDQQTHVIPSKQNLRDRLSLLMGYTQWCELEAELLQHQSRVNGIFSGLFEQPQNNPQQSKVKLQLDQLSEQQHLQALEELGFNPPDSDSIHQRLQTFYRSRALLYMSEKAKGRFHVFFPELLKRIAQHHRPMELLERLLALLSSIAGRSVYFELLYQNIPLLDKLVKQFERSDWIANEVTQHPILIESLLYPGRLAERFDMAQLQTALSVQLNNIEGDIELELDILRQFKRQQTIVIATAEIAGEITTDQVSQYLSELAEVLLQAVYRLARDELTALHGSPECQLDGATMQPGLSIIAYGKLGGYELHYRSDLDIIFLHNSEGGMQQTNGPKSIDNATFFARLAQKIISRISLLTAAGKLYEIDTRLRPDGASGMLVSALGSYQRYQQEKAWIWEHQALIRARFIAGDEALQAPFDNIRRQILQRPRSVADVSAAVGQMRDRIYQANKPTEGEFIHIKHSRGCLLDIEFLVQFWVLIHANKFASLTESTDNIGLLSELHHLELITDDELRLRDIYQTYHQWLHARVLQNQPAEIASSLLYEEIQYVSACWNRIFS